MSRLPRLVVQPAERNCGATLADDRLSSWRRGTWRRQRRDAGAGRKRGAPRGSWRSENQVLQDPELFPFLIVAPQAAFSWEKEQGRVENLVERLAQAGFVRGRPCLTGFSIGGDGAWAIAARQPSVFAAVAPVASEDPHGAQSIARALARVPIWISYRNDDEYAGRRRPSAVIDALSNTANSSVKVREYLGLTPEGWSPHGYVARQAYTDPDFYAWLRVVLK